MCTTLFAPLATMTTPFEGASQHQDSNLKCAEHSGDRKLPLNMKWVVDTDEHGIRTLCMRWTVALPPTTGKAKPPRVKPAVRRVWDSAAEPSARVAISNKSSANCGA